MGLSVGLGSCFPCKVGGAHCVKCFTSLAGLGKEHGGAEPASWSREVPCQVIIHSFSWLVWVFLRGRE